MAYDLLCTFLLMSLWKRPFAWNTTSYLPDTHCLEKGKISTWASSWTAAHVNILAALCRVYFYHATSTEKAPLWEGVSPEKEAAACAAPAARGGRRTGEAQAPAPPTWCSQQLYQVAPAGGRTGGQRGGGGGGGGIPAGRAAQWAGGDARAISSMPLQHASGWKTE